ncbi:hypothetical protein ADUPG1_010306 [Aduncisulcus paluster]|uniref:Uncharacterized protein n=2 Tax=Aduncisulcus paluster TaxID=2918883 RepID=A0ABQ5JWA8_9EUKA|nr:hypothetical protein ADUPG1_010306 [Aduncisulcus paluster]
MNELNPRDTINGYTGDKLQLISSLIDSYSSFPQFLPHLIHNFDDIIVDLRRSSTSGGGIEYFKEYSKNAMSLIAFSRLHDSTRFISPILFLPHHIQYDSLLMDRRNQYCYKLDAYCFQHDSSETWLNICTGKYVSVAKSFVQFQPAMSMSVFKPKPPVTLEIASDKCRRDLFPDMYTAIELTGGYVELMFEE